MKYGEFVELYESLSDTTKRLEKIDILSKFLLKLGNHGEGEWIYLLRGRVVPGYDPREFGISTQLVFKALSRALGLKQEDIVKRYRKVGDFGDLAEELSGKKKQIGLFSKTLTVKKVFEN